ncbi:hypothetical protein OF83DRAFT_1161136 [Amylostereum chailletii]|nr:hypothetical protein OF83DRAFT_1161136 [Amylostereum chailletii]
MSESCGNPAAEVDALMPKRARFDRSDQCVKCKLNRGNLVVRHAVYCRDCFAPLVATRFRKAFEPYINHYPDGPRRSNLKPSGDLLVALSGGLGSTVLLDLVHRTYLSKKSSSETKGGKEHPRKDKVWKKVRVCHIEIADAFPGLRDRTEEVRSVVSRYEGFEFVPLRLQDAFDPAWWKSVSGSTSESPPDFLVDLSNEELLLSDPASPSSAPLLTLQNYLRSLPTPTAVPTSIATLIRILLIYTAHSSGCSHLLLGTSLTSLSISLISSLSQGGGFVVPQASQEEWVPPRVPPVDDNVKASWRGEVRIIRPLKEVGMKECAAWAWWNQLPVVGKAKLPGTTSTINGLTKDFIVGLEKDYPSTVSTIARTVGKLAPKGEAGDRCILCELPAQSAVQAWKARISIRSRSGDAAPLSALSLSPLLCYSCHTTLTSRSSRSAVPTKAGAPPVASPIVHLPVWSAAHLVHRGPRSIHTNAAAAGGEMHRKEDEEVWERKKLNPEAMKVAVSEFLLDE